MFDLLNTINNPSQLRALERKQLPQLASELRAYVLDSVSQTGGHLSSNLGTVELTVALHYVFNTPDDRIVWDVGHQTYPHKILTGRREAMATLRQQGGISGFPKRSESPYDAFGTAHSSTSISAALGMAVASRNQNIQRQHIAVIGDGAMTAGMAFEAMNNAGVTPNVNLLVVLNDNDMSISPPVGALNRYLARLMSGKFYAAAKRGVETLLSVAPPLLEVARRFEEHAKGMVVPATLFEEFGFNYIGPIDGHDLDSLIPTLENLKQLGGVQFLHVVTKKGQGYKLAEADPVAYHGPGKFNPAEGLKKAASTKQTYTQVFGQWLCDQAAADDKLVGITPAMREGSGLVEFEKQFPQRYFDVGIAEQHAVTFAAGLACEGMKPVVAIYSTFLQRAYDQLIHDVALQNLDVTFALDRAGLVGADGATHAGNYDIAFLRCIPNMVVATPSDENECRLLLSTCYQHAGPSAVRYPRGSGLGQAISAQLETVALGKGIVRRQGKTIAFAVFGTLLPAVLAAAETLNATVVDMRFAKPIDESLLQTLAMSHAAIVTVEDGCIMGGAGSACAEALQKIGAPSIPLLHLGIPDQFIDHGEQGALYRELGLDAAGITRQVTTTFANLFEPPTQSAAAAAESAHTGDTSRRVA
ncbi:1-deoxy-D-xylulose-5-phosphate synthase [Parvibium lacunae]|uniref:1-deoxy-D-xylulose-5-phosphate synthase n=1 Tax=Parvibium lacunae TaxID=1888893 RepID=A0A368L6C2_9BURK|nr:1-deoxy-D-xylulose-5-phosphate synthase [Parvibium lacunae]RCS59238.1 1-deoxy-D-xylulose-5-phosphate synthase [Parvibium lacunae]